MRVRDRKRKRVNVEKKGRESERKKRDWREKARGYRVSINLTHSVS